MGSKNHAITVTLRPRQAAQSTSNHCVQPSQSHTNKTQRISPGARGLYSARLLHRSVPPHRHRDLLLDMYAQSFDLYNSPFMRAVPVASNTPSDQFASRFRSRQTTRVKVIGFDGKRVPAEQAYVSRQLDGFFPPVKLRSGDSSKQNDRSRSTRTSSHELSSIGIELAPCSDGNHSAGVTQCGVSPNYRAECSATHSMLKPRAHSSKSVKSNSSKRSDKSQRQKSSAGPALLSEVGHQHVSDKNNSMMNGVHQINDAHVWRKTNNFKAEPSKTINMVNIKSSKEVPWIYRYKIKRKMNELAKFMASQPLPDTEQNKTVTEYRRDSSNRVFPDI